MKEVSKAFDYIKKRKLIETLIHYKVNYKIIEVVANIYKDNYTVWRRKKKDRNHNWHKAMLYRINNTLKKIVTYMIMVELDKRGKGYYDEHISIKSLFFTDALMLSHSRKDAKDNLDIITQISREYGLEIYSEKSGVIIFNVSEQHEHLIY